jgi:glycine betaine/choline ABC-type transport system substrate-binding protein
MLRFMIESAAESCSRLKAGDLDIYPEYTGTALVNIMKHEVVSDPDRIYELVQKEFNEKYDLKWLKPFGLNNTCTLTMRNSSASRPSRTWQTISMKGKGLNRNE